VVGLIVSSSGGGVNAVVAEDLGAGRSWRGSGGRASVPLYPGGATRTRTDKFVKCQRWGGGWRGGNRGRSGKLQKPGPF